MRIDCFAQREVDPKYGLLLGAMLKKLRLASAMVQVWVLGQPLYVKKAKG